MKNKILKAPLYILIVVLITILALILVFVINVRLNAQSTGSIIGERTGTLVGRAVGSYEGLTEGRREGREAGKKRGLSAEDTTVDLSGKIHEVEKLEVLIASGTFSDVLAVGEKEDPDYAALISMKYNAVFTVNLENADIELKADGLHILLDQPELEFNPIGETSKRNEYQRHGWTGTAKAGYEAAINSTNEIKTKATEKLAGDESLMDAARSSAITQLAQLVNAVSLSKPRVFVEFRSGEEVP